jgi:hypothetical protein
VNSVRTLVTATLHRKTLQCVWIMLLAYFYVPTVLLSVVGNSHRNAQLLSELDIPPVPLQVLTGIDWHMNHYASDRTRLDFSHLTGLCIWIAGI